MFATTKDDIFGNEDETCDCSYDQTLSEHFGFVRYRFSIVREQTLHNPSVYTGMYK